MLPSCRFFDNTNWPSSVENTLMSLFSWQRNRYWYVGCTMISIILWLTVRFVVLRMVNPDEVLFRWSLKILIVKLSDWQIAMNWLSKFFLSACPAGTLELTEIFNFSVASKTFFWYACLSWTMSDVSMIFGNSLERSVFSMAWSWFVRLIAISKVCGFMMRQLPLNKQTPR